MTEINIKRGNIRDVLTASISRIFTERNPLYFLGKQHELWRIHLDALSRA